MAGTVKLNPELGERVAQTMSSILNGSVLETISEAYKACISLGDNNVTEGIQQNFMKFESCYNDTFLPVCEVIKKNAEEFTDLATAMGKVDATTDIKLGDVGGVTNAGFADAAAGI